LDSWGGGYCPLCPLCYYGQIGYNGNTVSVCNLFTNVVENSGNVEAEIRLHHESLLRRLEEDFQTVLRDLRSMRQAEAKRLQSRLSDLETSKLELEGLAGRLTELVSCGADTEVIRETLTSTDDWKPRPGLVDGSWSRAAIAFRRNSLLPGLQSNVMGQCSMSHGNVANNDGKRSTCSCTKAYKRFLFFRLQSGEKVGPGNCRSL